MPTLADLADQHLCRTQQMRAIAEGIRDCVERADFLEFINEYERLAREVNARDLGVKLPTRNAGQHRLWTP